MTLCRTTKPLDLLKFCSSQKLGTYNSLVFKSKVTTTDCMDFRESHHSKDEKMLSGKNTVKARYWYRFDLSFFGYDASRFSVVF